MSNIKVPGDITLGSTYDISIKASPYPVCVEVCVHEQIMNRSEVEGLIKHLNAVVATMPPDIC